MFAITGYGGGDSESWMAIILPSPTYAWGLDTFKWEITYLPSAPARLKPLSQRRHRLWYIYRQVVFRPDSKAVRGCPHESLVTSNGPSQTNTRRHCRQWVQPSWKLWCILYTTVSRAESRWDDKMPDVLSFLAPFILLLAVFCLQRIIGMLVNLFFDDILNKTWVALNFVWWMNHTEAWTPACLNAWISSRVRGCTSSPSFIYSFVASVSSGNAGVRSEDRGVDATPTYFLQCARW